METLAFVMILIWIFVITIDMFRADDFPKYIEICIMEGITLLFIYVILHYAIKYW